MEVSSHGPPGNTRSVAERLSAGLATGAVKLATPEGAAVLVNRSAKGRGLVAAQDLPAGALVCTLRGTFMDGPSRPHTMPGVELFHVRKPARGQLGRWLCLLPARSVDNLGNLLNTGDRSSDNNCELVYRSGNMHVTVKTVRAVAAGEELLASYGLSYNKLLKSSKREQDAQRAAGGSFGTVECGRCGRVLQAWQLKRHAGVACVTAPPFNHQPPR